MEFEMLASGYGLLEAPRVDDLGRLCFSDIPNGGIYRRNPGGNVETLIPKRKGVGGMNFNQSGGLVLTGRALTAAWRRATASAAAESARPWQLGQESHYDRALMLALSAERGGDPDRPGKRDALDPLLWSAARDGAVWERLSSTS